MCQAPVPRLDPRSKMAAIVAGMAHERERHRAVLAEARTKHGTQEEAPAPFDGQMNGAMHALPIFVCLSLAMHVSRMPATLTNVTDAARRAAVAHVLAAVPYPARCAAA